MKYKLINYLKKTLLMITFITGNILGINKKGISVICYHSISKNSNKYSISKKEFIRQVNKIKKSSNFINLQTLEETLRGNCKVRFGVLLTFDDGYEDIKNVIPFIVKNKIPAVLFVLSDPKNPDRDEIDNNFKLLSISEIKKLKKLGIEIGCHSATHADFSSLSNSEIKKEVIDAKNDLEKKLGINVDYFAYPKGFYSKELTNAVKKAGFKGAFAVKSGNVTSSTDRFSIPRVVIDKSYSLSDIPGIFSRSWFLLRNFTDGFRIYERLYKV